MLEHWRQRALAAESLADEACARAARAEAAEEQLEAALRDQVDQLVEVQKKLDQLVDQVDHANAPALERNLTVKAEDAGDGGNVALKAEDAGDGGNVAVKAEDAVDGGTAAVQPQASIKKQYHTGEIKVEGTEAWEKAKQRQKSALKKKLAAKGFTDAGLARELKKELKKWAIKQAAKAASANESRMALPVHSGGQPDEAAELFGESESPLGLLMLENEPLSQHPHEAAAEAEHYEEDKSPAASSVPIAPTPPGVPVRMDPVVSPTDAVAPQTPPSALSTDAVRVQVKRRADGSGWQFTTRQNLAFFADKTCEGEAYNGRIVVACAPHSADEAPEGFPVQPVAFSYDVLSHCTSASLWLEPIPKRARKQLRCLAGCSEADCDDFNRRVTENRDYKQRMNPLRAQRQRRVDL